MNHNWQNLCECAKQKKITHNALWLPFCFLFCFIFQIYFRKSSWLSMLYIIVYQYEKFQNFLLLKWWVIGLWTQGRQVNVTDVKMIKWTWGTLSIQIPAFLDIFQGPYGWMPHGGIIIIKTVKKSVLNSPCKYLNWSKDKNSLLLGSGGLSNLSCT